jgi:hypothetical protein
MPKNILSNLLKHQFRREMVMKKLYMLLAAVLIIIITGCSGGSDSDPIPAPPSSVKAITAFSLNGVAGTINETGKTIAVSMPYGTEVTAMVATFTTTGASVTVGSTAQINGTTVNDFTGPVVYAVTAVDATSQNYTVVVTVAASSAKAITAFSLSGVVGTINETGKTIAVTMPFGTSVTNLIATFTTTGTSVKVGSNVQVSGTTANNFASPAVYTVTAADATTQDYTVNVTVAASSAKAIAAFSLNGVAGTINETGKTIAVTMPFGTSVTNLIATFTTTGTSVKVGSTLQVSGTTARNFTGPVVYTVTAADATTQDYEVTVTVAPSSAKEISAFTFPNLPSVATIDEVAHTIALTVPSSADVTALVAAFTTTGASVIVGSNIQISGTTANDFTGPVVYTVTAADATTQDYTVNVTVTALVLFGATHYSVYGTSYLYEVNTTDGTTTEIGDIGFSVNGMAYDAVTNKLYGTTTNNDSVLPWGLIEIDMTTGVGTPVGTGTGLNTMTPTFNSSGTLFAWDAASYSLCTIDLATGIATSLDPSNITYGPNQHGLAFDNSDVLYLINGNPSDLGSVYIMDQTTGEGFYVGYIDLLPYGMAHHGDFHPVTGKYWGLDATTSTRNLLEINIATKTIGQTIPTLDYLHVLAFGYK